MIISELDINIVKMSRNMFELYAKTKLDIASEAKCGSVDDIYTLDILKPLPKEIDHGILTATISQLILSDQMKKSENEKK